MAEANDAVQSAFDEITNQIKDKNQQITAIFEVMRQAITVAERDISNRSAKILTQLEPITKMLECNQTIARELASNVNAAIATFSSQQQQIESLSDKILPKISP